MRPKAIFALAVAAGLPVCFADQTAAPPPSPTTIPSVQNSDSLSLRALPAVLDARERRQDWHEAAQQAASRIQDPALLSQFDARISGLAPQIARALIARPQEEALVTVAVYRDEQGRQAMVAVTFDGLSSQIGSDFLAGVVADAPASPQAEGIPKSLRLDSEATSYLLFFLGNRRLEAGDIPQTTLAKSILLLANRRQEQSSQGIASSTGAGTAPPPASVQPQPQYDQAAQQAGAYQPAVIPEFPEVNDGYYYPGMGVPIVILPETQIDTPQWRDQQRRREEQLERQYRATHPTAPAPQTPGAANVPPGVTHSVLPTPQSTPPPANNPKQSPAPGRSAPNPPAAGQQPSRPPAREPPPPPQQPPPPAHNAPGQPGGPPARGNGK